MNPNDPRHPWTRLTAAARNARDARDASAPYGFSTRVAALAFAQPHKLSSLFDLFALRALGVACLLALFSLAMNYTVFTNDIAVAVATADEVSGPAVAVDDAVSVVLDSLSAD